ncbi:MAG: DNA replication/repair protein RecF [Anaerovoracaceae bacterium]|jgi:DNA replication and repair protein RecF
MIIKNIKLENFRNYRELDIDFHPQVNLFLGENAQGKTNLLEGIYITSIGKSFRTTKDKELIYFDEEFCRVVVSYQGEVEGEVSIAIGRDGKRLGKINGIKIEKTSQLMDHVLAVIFSPEDLKIVKEDPEKRRRFIDRELCQLKLSYYRNLNRYNKVLLQRNAYLKEEEIKEGALFVWDEHLIQYGQKLVEDRDEFVKKLDVISRDIHQGITEGVEKLTIRYAPSIHVAEDYRKALSEGLETDKMRGNTSRGPHRDDFEVFIDGKNVRSFGSQGQQRTAALSIKLAEIQLIREEKAESPILLLDDVFSELDSSRQRYLIDYLEGLQIFITGADISPEVISSFPKGKTFFIQGGKIMDVEER